ncbi:hypothetical protein [Natronorubrum sp. FCH18a]|uniref:hypothetical protein n=1 Tax=Natronorubrum sp. FCH18a TaxID=3447018 RepID=UPI003F5162D5
MSSQETIFERAEQKRRETLETIRTLTERGETDAMNGGVPVSRLLKEMTVTRGALKGYLTTLREEGKIRKVKGLGPDAVRPSYLLVETVDDDGDDREIRADGGTVSGDTYRCIHEDCRETFSHKVRARDHARKHMPSVGNYGMYDFIEIIPERERYDKTATESTGGDE